MTLAALTACGSSPLEEEFDKWATRWGITDEVGQHSEDGLRTAGNTPCRNPLLDLTVNERSLRYVIKPLGAMMMAVCPAQAPVLIQTMIDQGPSSGPVHDELSQMLTDVRDDRL